MAQNPSVVSTSTIEQAASGNAALRALLTQLATAANTQATKTSTSGKNPPNQSTATVSYQSPFFLVTFTDPGGASAATLAQQQQQAANSPLGANSSLSNIYHQVQAATSVLFDAASNLVTYGGDNGSLQTQYSLVGLTTTDQWYFRIRTSFDGTLWNQWKIINASKAISGNPNAVALSPIAGGQQASITLPGAQIVGFGVGLLASGLPLGTADGVLIANAIGIIAPATTNDTGHRAGGIKTATINSLGVCTLAYDNGGSGSGEESWDGDVNFITFGWATGNQNIALQTLADGGRWAIITLAGGTQIAIGEGLTAPGVSFDLPAGYTAANVMGVCTPASFNFEGNLCHGIKQSNVVGTLPTVLYGDGSGNTWTGNANWFAIAWPETLAGNVKNVTGGKYLILPTPSGNVALGVGSTASGGVLPLPAGYTFPKALAFGTMGSYNDIGSYMHGVKICTIDVGNLSSVGTVYGIYTDGTEAVWDGNVNWFTITWP